MDAQKAKKDRSGAMALALVDNPDGTQRPPDKVQSAVGRVQSSAGDSKRSADKARRSEDHAKKPEGDAQHEGGAQNLEGESQREDGANNADGDSDEDDLNGARDAATGAEDKDGAAGRLEDSQAEEPKDPAPSPAPGGKQKKTKTVEQIKVDGAKEQLSRYKGTLTTARGILLSIEKDPSWSWARSAGVPLKEAVDALDAYTLTEPTVKLATVQGLPDTKKDSLR